MCSVTWHLSSGEAGDDLILIVTSSYHEDKSSEVSVSKPLFHLWVRSPNTKFVKMGY